MKMKEEETDGVTKIHNVRFYNLPPRSINCMSYNSRSAKLALSRSDGSIEIWDMSYAAFLEKTIAGENNLSIEGLGWAGDRLFTAGLVGEVIEWDLTTLSRKHVRNVTGRAIWCLDINRAGTCIALGTEEGYLNAFDIDEDGLTYRNMFDKQEGRIVCCKFDATGDFIVTGSLDTIRIWDAKTGHAVHKMSMGRAEMKRETIVWSVQVLKDFTILSGDSRGQVTVWDGNLGTLIESHQALKADVLTVAVNDKEDFFMCSGIDPIIRIYSLTEVKKSEKTIKRWIKYYQRSVHDHDVKALLCIGTDVMSGGMDGYLAISSYKKIEQDAVKHGPFLQSPCAAVSPEARLLLLQYGTGLEVWRLGTALNRVQLNAEEETIKDNRKFLSLKQGPEKLIELHSVNNESVVCSILSPDGRWVIYSTKKAIRVFTIASESGRPAELVRVKELPAKFAACSKMLFSADSRTLFLVKPATNQVDVFNILANDEIDHVATIDTSRHIKDVIHLIAISHCGRFLIIAGTCRTISVWSKTKKQWKHHFNLPKYMVPTTAIAIHYNAPRLVATFTDGKIFEYDLEEMGFTCSANERFVPNCHTHCVNNIVLSRKNENIFVFHNDTNLYVLEKQERGFKAEQGTKVAKVENSKTIGTLKLRFQKTFEHFVYLARLSDNEVVAVGVNPVSLIEQLPPNLKQKKFGAA